MIITRCEHHVDMAGKGNLLAFFVNDIKEVLEKNKQNRVGKDGNILATENQQARIIDVIEVKIGVYLHET